MCKAGRASTMFRLLFKFLSILLIVVTFQFQFTYLMPIWSRLDTQRVIARDNWKLEQSTTSQESPMAERSLEQLVAASGQMSPSEYDLKLSKGQSALYKVPASVQRFDSQVHERKTGEDAAAASEGKSVQSSGAAPPPVGASQTVMVLLGYCFILFALIAVLFFAVTGFTGQSKKKGAKREKDSDTEKMSSSGTRSKRSKSEERHRKSDDRHRKKHKKRKERHDDEEEDRREKEESLDTEGDPKSESIFVPLPTDDERRGEKYRQRRKERREKRRHRREKKRAEMKNTEKRERKRKRRQERLRRLEQLNSETADEASNTEPAYGEPEGAHQQSRSLSELPYSFLAPEGVSWASQTFTSPETESEPDWARNETQQEQLHASVVSPMAGLDRNAVIFVLKSDIPQLNTDRVYISLPDDPLDGKQLPKSVFVDKPKPDKPVTTDSDSPSPGSPPQTTILYQSPICRTFKASGSLVRSPKGAGRSKKGVINAKAVLDAIVRPITAQSITKGNGLSEQPSAVTSSINDTNSSIIFDLNRQRDKRGSRPSKVTLREESSLVRDRPKSILRRSTSSAYRDDSPESLDKLQRSLKRVSFSQQMQVRYIQEANQASNGR